MTRNRRLRLMASAVLLFLVVAVDFTSRVMSVFADGVLVVGILVLVMPLIHRDRHRDD